MESKDRDLVKFLIRIKHLTVMAVQLYRHIEIDKVAGGLRR
jgi:hypothetical protein